MSFKTPICYDDIFDAIEFDIIESGLTKKELATVIWPGRRMETAKSLLSRALSSENTDVHLFVEHLIALMDQTGGKNIINYLCDRYFFQRPQKRDPQAAALDKDAAINGLLEQCEAMGFKLKQLARREP